MPVKKFTEAAGQPAHLRTAAVQKAATAKLISATKARSDVIAQIDDRVSRLSAAFNSKKRQFTRAELGKVTASLKIMAREVNKEARSSLEHMNTALRLNIATNKIVAQTEDLSALHGKISILHRVASASLAGDDGDDDMVQLDDSGYVVDGGDDNILDDLPTAPAPGAAPTAAKRRRANQGVNNLDENEGLDGEPVGVPQEETVDEQTDPSDPGSRGSPKPTNMNLSEAAKRKASALRRQARALLRQAGDLDGEPVGVPEPYDAGGTQDTDDYGTDEPGTSPPSTTLSKRRRKADDSDDLPSFLQDDTSSRKSRADVSNDGDPDYSADEPGSPSETVKVSNRRRRADENDFQPPNGEDLADDVVSKRKAGAQRRRADGTMPSAPPAAPADPDLAAGGTDPNDPSMDPTMDPTMADDGLDPSMDPSMDPTMADDDGMDPMDPSMDPTMADDGTDPDDLSDMDPSMDPTMADGGDDLGLTPDDGMDQMLQAEILADGDFPLDGSDTDPTAPAPGANDLTSSARAARRMTAARSGRAAPANAAGDALKSMIESEFR